MRVPRPIYILTCLLTMFDTPSTLCQQTHPQTEPPAQHKAQKTEPQAAGIDTNRPVQEKEAGGARGSLQAGSAPSEQVPRWLQIVKAGTETLAYLLAFIFFLYKSYEGYLTANLSLSLQCKRCAGPPAAGKLDKDYLAVIATIKKGNNGLIKLLQAEVQITAPGLKLPLREVLDVRRLDYDRSKVLKGEKFAINWRQEREGWPFLQFPPGEDSQFALWLQVPTGEPCQVELVLMGRGRWPKIKTSQWRASDVSLPKYTSTEGDKEAIAKA